MGCQTAARTRLTRTHQQFVAQTQVNLAIYILYTYHCTCKVPELVFSNSLMLLYTVHFNLSLLFYREFMSSYNLCLLLESLLVQSAGVPRSLKSMHVLRIQVLRRPLDMVICERGHEVVAVVVVRLQAELDALVVACLLCCLDEVLWQELLLLVEVVAGALSGCISMLFPSPDVIRTRTTSMSISRGPFHFLMSSVASCSAHFSFWSSPK